jgi:class 3 adenylate cyclase
LPLTYLSESERLLFSKLRPDNIPWQNIHIQLAAILFADIVGYTSMMQEDEEAAVAKITRFREENGVGGR